MRKTTTFAAALALAQNAPHIALEIVGTVRQQNYMTVRNLKVLALAQLGRADDALPILRSVMEVHDPAQNKHTFSKDVVRVNRLYVFLNVYTATKQTFYYKSAKDMSHEDLEETPSLICYSYLTSYFVPQ